MTAWYLSSVPWHWQESLNSYVMSRMCPRYMTNDRVFTLCSIKGKVFTPYFQSMRAMATLYVKHEIRPSPSMFNGHVTPLKLWLSWIHLQWCLGTGIYMCPVFCTAGGQLYCTSCIGSDYTSKLDRAAECSWSWQTVLWNCLNSPRCNFSLCLLVVPQKLQSTVCKLKQPRDHS